MIPDAPQIGDLVFRRFRGASDYAHMLAVLDAHTIGHGIEYANTLAAIEFVFAHLTNCEPNPDVLIAKSGRQSHRFQPGVVGVPTRSTERQCSRAGLSEEYPHSPRWLPTEGTGHVKGHTIKIERKRIAVAWSAQPSTMGPEDA